MSLFEDQYKTINEPSEGVFRDKGSKFIAYSYPFTDENKLKDILGDVKSTHPKARHHCYAYRLGMDRSVFRINDDNEPSGSAGRPILNTLLSNDLTNILVIVVRYFGGTLLGIPGLINAYKSAAQESINNATIVEKYQKDIYRIDFDYLQMNNVMRIIKDEDLDILSQTFDNNCKMEITIRTSLVNRVTANLSTLPDLKFKYLKTI
ncbi:IMPACT family protein [Albibacterium bauzanense]|uniref:Putative YigZ family protein n=1 Tax=Albibacterium bauzanense TaxID=653929 RepID=A0A4R1M6P2_9SPHI|nr:YigZ family protein [Albibacterium bauzanense]TCK85429.1 putative YigZ family protein [Albibacterium bauzanense]